MLHQQKSTNSAEPLQSTFVDSSCERVKLTKWAVSVQLQLYGNICSFHWIGLYNVHQLVQKATERLMPKTTENLNDDGRYCCISVITVIFFSLVISAEKTT